MFTYFGKWLEVPLGEELGEMFLYLCRLLWDLVSPFLDRPGFQQCLPSAHWLLVRFGYKSEAQILVISGFLAYFLSITN